MAAVTHLLAFGGEPVRDDLYHVDKLASLFGVTSLSRFRLGYAVASTILFAAASVRAQANVSVVNASLLGKTFFLRSLCAGDDLHFAADGKPTSACVPEPFSVGLLTIDKVEEKSSELQLTAHRVGLTFQNNIPQQVDLSHPRNGRKPHAVVLHVAASPSGNFAEPLAEVFTDSFDNLLPNVPEAWHGFIRAYLLTPAAPPAVSGKRTSTPAASSDSKPLTQEEIDQAQINPMANDDLSASAVSRRGVEYPWAKGITAQVGKNGVSVPKVIKQRLASFSPQARSMAYSGKCIIHLVLDDHGNVQHPSVQSPAGLGLDEQALAAVAQYQFQPPMKEGRPVAVAMNIEVSFEVY